MAVPEEFDQSFLEKHKTFISSVIKEGQAEYGKQILALSASVLALSVAFIKNIIGDHNPREIIIIYIAWVAFVIAIAAVLCSIQASINAHKQYLKELERIIAGGPPDARVSWQEKAVPKLNIGSTICFGIGLVFLVVFASLNLRRGADMSNKWIGANDSIEVQRVVVTGELRECVEVQRAPTPTPAVPSVPAPTSNPQGNLKK